MEKQIIPAQQVEKVHQIMNYIYCFAPDLNMHEDLTAEEFYLALENMNKNEKFDQLVNYVAASFIMSLFKDIKAKNKYQDYLSYEYDYSVIKSMRMCFKRIDDNVKTFIQMWRQFLEFFVLIKPFRKQYLIPNYSASTQHLKRDQEEEDEEEIQDAADNFDDQNNSRNSSKSNENNSDEDDLNDKSNQNSAEKPQQAKKQRNVSAEDQLYEHYRCNALSDTDVLFADFSTNEKLEAFLILVKIGYKLPFCQEYLSNRFKSQIKDESIRSQKNTLIEKESEREELQKELEELQKILDEYTLSVQDDISLLPADKLQQYKKEKAKLNPLKQKLDRSEKNITKLSEDLRQQKKKQYFQLSNWVQLGKDKYKNLYYACAYETNYVFKKVFKQGDKQDQIECHMRYYDDLSILRSEFNLNNIADDQLWDKINTLNRDGILTIPEIKPTICIDEELLQDSESSNKSRKDSINNYYKAKAKLIKENILNRQFSFIKLQQKQSFQSSNKKKSVTNNFNVDDLEGFAYNKRLTRSITSNQKRKKVIIDDSSEEEDEEEEELDSRESSNAKDNYEDDDDEY